MAIGDQVHWIAATYASTAIRPASGVEVVLKEVNAGVNGSTNWSYFYHRIAGNTYSAALIAGGHALYNSYYTKSSSWAGGSAAGSAGAAYNGHANMSVPVNNTYYINAAYNSQGGGIYVGGYITKE